MPSANCTIVKTATAGCIANPVGTDLEMTLNIDEAFSMTGKTVYFALREHAEDGTTYEVNSADDPTEVTVAAQAITISIPAANIAALQSGVTHFRVDVGDPVEIRIQGDFEWIEEEGAWT